MKKLLFLAAIAISLSVFTSCTRSSADTTTIDNAATTGQWKVGYYWDEKDETSNFAGWVFTFNANGTASATNGAATINGTWLVKEGEFRIDLGAGDPLSGISKHWLIVEKSNTAIKLKDDNSLQDDQLHLVKI
jgi:hypothetical protein